METTIRLGYPLLSEASGPVTFTYIEKETKSLHGLYL
jgi:hypothetical protein